MNTMAEKTVTIRNKLGLHARAASMFVKEAERYACEVEMEKAGVRVNAKSIMGILMLAAPFGSTLKIIAKGPNDEECVTALARLVEVGFEEEA